ncbi:Na/Pi cotransporter family protein [Thiomicrorhabdus xiamenensis]|uniref:Na/Pi cotransporter family protein n=1 Tax=Thiomicrorhabdus xiamenensis TaxID=2739063 RepID=A0A7D4P4K2_9GAMM|nr:Na/Pi symporter [Thiomicrorhabdus xiamenensis]QKI89316.1 Na/Pi cotransporter family protein [Thiomicrorhabdus xiamenensis]
MIQEAHNLLLAGGGLGIFLLGMVIMTDSLKKLAGDKIRSALLRFTRTPTTGAITGAISTAIVQSSSATTLAAIGFVGAGLMSFSNSLGIIFGANIGTTITGWMVALLGFKFSIASIASLILLGGTLLYLFGSHKLKHAGMAIAGFALLFIGIDTMQHAMSGLVEFVDFSNLPANNLSGILQLLLIGLLFTAITQSSSAGVALTLTALFSGLLAFEQAIALVIGMDIGTTVKSLVAVIGGTTGAKRTGLSHVVYNLLTAVLALFLIIPYVSLWEWFSPDALYENAEIAVVGFHTLFNLLGVILILPFTKQFARLIIRMFPQDNIYIDTFDPQLLNSPDLALNAVQQSLLMLSEELIDELKLIVSDPTSKRDPSKLQQLQQNLDQTQYYLDEIHLSHSDHHQWQRLVEMIHILDHLQRLHERCEEESDRAEASKQFPTLHQSAQRMAEDIQNFQYALARKEWQQNVVLTEALSRFMNQDAETYRHEMVERMGQGEINADQCWDSLEAIRWMQRVSHHLARLSLHLQQMVLQTGK